jgi:hypothetical protein
MVGQQRLIVRRTRLAGSQAEPVPDWRRFAFLITAPRRRRSLDVIAYTHAGTTPTRKPHPATADCTQPRRIELRAAHERQL